LLDGRPPARDSPARAIWDELKLDLSSALMFSEYDPRVFLGLSTEQQQGWRQRQREFLAAHFRNDPRVRREPTASALARIDPGLLAKIGPPTFRDTPATDEDSRGADG
jgi:hypothetical protein